jgi:AhpD family alkylhydroperoxidase
MQARMNHPVFVLPAAFDAMQALASATDGIVPDETLELVHLRASQINGCSVCVDLAACSLEQSGVGLGRALAVAAWYDSPAFNDAERAALALTEAVTRLADRTDPVPDDVWDDAARHYDEQQLSALLIRIAVSNVWNRLNVATRQVAGRIPAA